ncbi:MAG: DUF5661 family protein [Syntrophorhabdales bacterium]|jgi:hypothetical protein
MKLPEYITTAEVRKVCKEIGIRDWTKLKHPLATAKEAKIILGLVNAEKMPIDVREFLAGLNVELEHGTRFKDANVTNNHPVVTGKIVRAHMKESLDYYKLLEVAELEGDLFKAVSAGNPAKIKAVYKKLAEAKIVLCAAESKKMGPQRKS